MMMEKLITIASASIVFDLRVLTPSDVLPESRLCCLLGVVISTSEGYLCLEVCLGLVIGRQRLGGG